MAITEHGGRQREPRLQVQRVAEEEPEPGAWVRSWRDDELPRDDPERLGNDQAGEERNEEVPGGSSCGRSGGRGRRHGTIQPGAADEFKVAPRDEPSYY